jgi:hypothetical protein
MPFYIENNIDKTVSTITQLQTENNCYIKAALAAAQICGIEFDTSEAIKACGYGMGGNGSLAFKAIGRFPMNKGGGYEDKFYQWILLAVDKKYPVCLGVHWQNTLQSGQKGKSGNHCVYLIGYEGTTAYARDQQNGHHLIEFPLHGDEFNSAPCQLVGKTSSSQEIHFTRTFHLDFITVGFPNGEASKEFG